MFNKENRSYRKRFYHRDGPEYSSEPDLTTADKEPWNSGFPPGFTVDKLRYHRRKRAPIDLHPSEHIQIEEGQFCNLKSEYRRRYKNYSASDLKSEDVSPVRVDDTFKLDQGGHVEHTDSHESFSGYSIDRISRRRRRKRNAFQLIDDVNMALYDENLRLNPYVTSESRTQYVKYENPEKVYSLRRNTNLKLEGNIESTTEKAEQFIEYLLNQRRDLIRNPTHLKLEGDMEKKTEMREQFVPRDYQPRPPLCKKFTNLHLEGEFDILTENNEQYIPYALEQRPPLMKRSTNLHLEGDLELKPEYRQAFIELKGERRNPSFPQNNLKSDGFFETTTENKEKFVDHEIHPTIPFLRGDYRGLHLGDDKPTKFPEYKEKFIPHCVEKALPVKRIAHFRPEGEFSNLSETKGEFIGKTIPKIERTKMQGNLYLEGELDLSPEYKNVYVDYYKGGNVGRRRRTYSQSSNLKSEGTMEIYPEYKRSFVDFPRQRPSVRKPENQLSSEGEMNHLTEKRAQFVGYGSYPRASSLKRDTQLKLDGEFECQPEYRKAYIDYLMREQIDRKPRPLDNLGVTPKRAFEILPSSETTTSSKKETSDSSAAPKTDTTPSSPPKSLIPVKITSTTDSESSTIPRPKTTRRKSLSKLESKLFGPKIVNPSSKSRSPSPLHPPKSSSRARSVSNSRIASNTRATPAPQSPYHADRTGKRFMKSIRVEDLAYTPCTSPIPTRKIYPSSSTRKKWNKNEVPDASSFYILQDDINNNSDYEGYAKALQKEQKWMPSWYNST